MEDGDISVAKVQAPLNDAASVTAGESDDIVAKSPQSGNMANYPDVEVTVINKSSKTNNTGTGAGADGGGGGGGSDDGGGSDGCDSGGAGKTIITKTVMTTTTVSEDDDNTESSIKVNGESDKVVHSDEHDEEYTSDEDALVIDEGCKKDNDTRATTTTTTTTTSPSSAAAAAAAATTAITTTTTTTISSNSSGSGGGGVVANRKRVRSPSPRANFKGFKKRIIAKSLHFRKVVNDLKSASFYIELRDGKETNTQSLDQKICLNQTNSASGSTPTPTTTTTTTMPTAVRQNKHTNTITSIGSSSSSASGGGGGGGATANKTTSLSAISKTTTTTTSSSSSSSSSANNNKNKKTTNKKRPSQKLTEYAQYLGLQPAVKFKCVKCSESSFQSLSALNEHQRHCLSSPRGINATGYTTTTGGAAAGNNHGNRAAPSSNAGGSGAGAGTTTTPPPTSTNFRVTRKVFLCSSCGTYYENCNLFLHMREVHRRYICLYCLGMFSLPEKLSHHLVTKHSCAPKHYASADDFLNSYTESCFLVCCHCERVFSERDNFFDHVCVEKRTGGDKTCGSCGVKSNNSAAHAATCKAALELLPLPSTSSTSTSTITVNKSIVTGHHHQQQQHQQQQQQQQHQQQHSSKSTSKQNKVSKSTRATAGTTTVTHVEHITADSPSTSAPSPPLPAVAAAESSTTTPHQPQAVDSEVEHTADMNTDTQFTTTTTTAAATASPASVSHQEEDMMNDEPTLHSSTTDTLHNNNNNDDDDDDDAGGGGGGGAGAGGADDDDDGGETADAATGNEPTSTALDTVCTEQKISADSETEMEVDKATEHDAGKEAAEQDGKVGAEQGQREEPLVESETTTTTTQIENGDSEDETKSQTEENAERKSASDQKDEEEAALSEASSDESMVCDRNNTSEPEGGGGNPHSDVDATPTSDTGAPANLADGPETNESPASPTDNGRISHTSTDLNQSDELEHKDDSDDDDDNNKESIAGTGGGGGEENEEEEEEEEEDEEADAEEEEQQEQEESMKEPVEETRKVPKVTLKLPPQSMVAYSENDSDDSEKLTMEVEENCDSDDGSKTADDSQDKPVNGFDEENERDHQSDEEYVPVAGEDVPIVELELEQPLDRFSMESLLRRCLGATIPTCVYCNHARKIAVNGKQLGLHAIAEHRFAATVNSITAEELIPASFVTRIKECLPEVESVYFSLDVREQDVVAAAVAVVATAAAAAAAAVPPTEDDPYGAMTTAVVVVPPQPPPPPPPPPPPTTTHFKRVYECFQCRYVTSVHKELYLHNRKMHAKTILLCIMCKSNFYSYSELICHLCPGNYVLHSETMFRCCMCNAPDLPSAFRLMVHLRKRHHTCDVCLEGCHNQSKLSNHVWKHKLHHLCYRCGIAYRNKPDITKHLFWKHGTESVLCKKCLQKKWPHVYHFCIPPASFVCEECSLSFCRAVYLKVHKRLHSHEKPHACTEHHCTDTFISRKLLLKHEARHRNPVPQDVPAPPHHHHGGGDDDDVVAAAAAVKEETNKQPDTKQADGTKPSTVTDDTSQPADGERVQDGAGDKDEPKKSLIDVYDLPALNLSESDSDDSEDEKVKLAAAAEIKQEDDTTAAAAAAKEEGDKDKGHNDTEHKMKEERVNSEPVPSVTETAMDEDQKPVPILDGIWDNFKNYQATIEKRGVGQKETGEQCDDVKVEPMSQEDEEEEEKYTVAELEVVLADHDYCLPPTETTNISIVEESVSEPLDTKSKIGTEGGGGGMDHDYCTVGRNADNTNNNQAKSAHPAAEGKPSGGGGGGDKKKSKSQKKKNTSTSTKPHNAGSSSSSDSSSDSDSSSCTCGSNCSCSSSSGSSSSSSSSSESDSSSSEGKKRIQARRDRRKERAKRKKDTETSHAVSNTSAAVAIAEEPPVPLLPPIPELPIEESDLDTEETETDEDFYDEHPQRLANKIMAEKRNQLALLAAVAPPLNNGNVSVDYTRPSTPPSLAAEEQLTTTTTSVAAVHTTTPLALATLKKKVKAKKRKKKSRNSTPKQDVQVHHNIPEYPQLNHIHAMSPVHQVMQPVHQQRPLPPPPPPVTPVVVQAPSVLTVVRTPLAETTPKQHRHHHRHQQQHNQGSGSETDSNVRSSKRRRVPNKFYGYSSDEDANDKPTPGPTSKWRKSEISASVTTHHVTGSPQFVPPITIKNIPPSPAPLVEPVRALVIHHGEVADSDTDEEDDDDDEEQEEQEEDEQQAVVVVAPPPPPPHNRKSEVSEVDSSDSNRNDDDDDDDDDEDSDSDTGQLHISQPPAAAVLVPTLPPPSGYSAAAIAHHQAAAAAGERNNENLYCYCQCPYDEVSEMIACDGKDCAIEWFHFECVGIMVPPKGKWFCPDCRRKSSSNSSGGGGIGRSDFIQT